ncbi:MAG: ATP-binding protein [Corynebacterium sp.]|nr:ATP-binding protein [Corynebacterium sp.]
MEFIPRGVATWVEELLHYSPIVAIQGARQVGKSTLVEHLNHPDQTMFFNLDDPIQREAIANDLDGFLNQPATNRIVIDEVQRLPELILALKRSVDKQKIIGRFLITGSANLLRVPKSEDSLAGRAMTVQLESFAQCELQQNILSWVDFVMNIHQHDFPSINKEELAQMFIIGGYPAVQYLPVGNTRLRRSWYLDYTNRLLERDIADLGRVDTKNYKELLKLCAILSSEELVKEQLAKNLRVSRETITRYVDLLNSLYLLKIVPPWSRNTLKRVIKRPKIFLADTGLAATLAGDTTSNLVSIHGGQRLGSLLETFVVTEILKQQTWSETDYEVYYFRDERGMEIDLIIETPEGIIAVEVKASSSPSLEHFKHLKKLRDILGTEFRAGIVINTGTMANVGDRLWAVPVSSLWMSGGL